MFHSDEHDNLAIIHVQILPCAVTDTGHVTDLKCHHFHFSERKKAIVLSVSFIFTEKNTFIIKPKKKKNVFRTLSAKDEEEKMCKAAVD